MILLINRYIAKSVLLATLLVLLLVTGLTYLITLLGELKDIGSGDYGLLQAVIHALLVLPHDIYEFFPMLVLLGGLTGLGSLAAYQELIVMRTSGMSIGRIARAVLGAALVLIVIGLLIGEALAPRLYDLGDQYKTAALSGGQAVSTQSGLWVHEGNNFLHIDSVMPHNHLEGVTRYEFDANHKLLASYYVKSMDYVQKQWQVHDVVETSFANDKTISRTIPESTWDLHVTPSILNVGLLEPEEMSLQRLAKYIHHLTSNKLQAIDFQFSFWKRILAPLTTLVMLLLAIPFVFAAPRSMSGGWRILLGVAVGFVFYILDALLAQLSIVFQLSPFIAALLPIVLFALLGYGLMLRCR